jgi:hypothetical protein
MPHSRRLYDMLPIYAQLADERGVLQHICDVGVQPQLNIFYKLIALQEYLYDPDHPASFPHLDWLGQFVGLGKIEDHYLGIGINPNWENADKRNLIKKAWKYWQAKGTQKGIRQAIALWLLWDKAEDRQILEIRLPLGRFPCEEPPNWVTYGTRYDHFRTQTFKDLQRVGWGDAPGNAYRPRYDIFANPKNNWLYGARYSDRRLIMTKPQEISTDFSRMGTFRPWVHFNELDEVDWHKIFPDILDLNPEIWIAPATPTVIGWFHFPARKLKLERSLPPEPQKYKHRFSCDGINYGDRYRPRVVQEQEEVIVGERKWTFWDKSCHYGDRWGWTKEQVQIPPPLPPMILCRLGDSYGTAAKSHERASSSLLQPAKFYYGAGTLVESVTEDELLCSPGIWYRRPARESLPRRSACQVLTFQTYEISSQKSDRIASVSTLWGDRFFGLNELLPTVSVETPGVNGRLVSAIAPFGFWNSAAPCNYFVRAAREVPGNKGDGGDLIQLCHQTRRYSSRTLTLLEKTEIPKKLESLQKVYPILKLASDMENWRCQISTELGWLVYPPTSLIALDNPDWKTAKRSTAISVKFPYLLVEFLARPEQDTRVNSVTLQLADEPIESRCFDKPLFMSALAGFGVRFVMEFGLVNH